MGTVDIAGQGGIVVSEAVPLGGTIDPDNDIIGVARIAIAPCTTQLALSLQEKPTRAVNRKNAISLNCRINPLHFIFGLLQQQSGCLISAY